MRCSCSNRVSTLDAIVRAANAQLADHQKIRRALVWPEPELPRTEGTRKLKRAAIREWMKAAARRGTSAPAPTRSRRSLRSMPGRETDADTTLEELGLSSLERVELMVALEDAFGTRIDESAFAGARRRRPRSAGRTGAAAGARAGRAGRFPALEPLVAGSGHPPASACRPGFFRWRASSRGSGRRSRAPRAIEAR